MHRETVITDVSDTAFWVAHFRAIESERSSPLFRDPYAKQLAGTRGPAMAAATASISRYTEWTVLARTVIIDRFITNAVKSGVDTIINLGAGLDTRPYRMSLPEKLSWIEADYSQTIEYKRAILAAEKPACSLEQVAIDLADIQARREFFNSVARDSKNILILTEGVIPYLSVDAVHSLATDLFAQQRFRYWLTEYMHRSVYYPLKKAAQHPGLKNSPFQFFPEDWFNFFAQCGWLENETRYIGEIALEFNRKMPLPKWLDWSINFFPSKIRQQVFRSSGFVMLERDSRKQLA